MSISIRTIALALVAAWTIIPARAAGPSFVDITWMSIANLHYQLGGLGIVTDGYISRIPQSEFYGGGGGLANTRNPYKPDVAAVTKVWPHCINLCISGSEDHQSPSGGRIGDGLTGW